MSAKDKVVPCLRGSSSPQRIMGMREGKDSNSISKELNVAWQQKDIVKCKSKSAMLHQAPLFLPTGIRCVSEGNWAFQADISAGLQLNTQAAGMVGFHEAAVLGQTLGLRNKLQSWQFSHEQNAGICPVRKPAQRHLTWKTKQAPQLLIQSSSIPIDRAIPSHRNGGADPSVRGT